LETVAITVTDTQETPTGTVINSVTWSGNDAKTITVTGNAGLYLTATSTALTSVDASGITGTKDSGGFKFTSGALAAAATIKGSAAADNTINFSAAVTKAVSYIGGTGKDAITGTNGKDNVVDLGIGKNSFTGAAGNNTVTGGKDADTVTLTSGNNTVSLGDGANGFTATSGNNTYTGGKDVDTVTVENGNNTITTGTGDDVISVGGGLNIVSMGAGKDALSISARPINGNIFTTVTDINVGDTINLAALTTADSKGGALGSKINLADTAAFADYLAAAAAGVIVSNPTGPSTMAWFQFGGNTFIVVDDTNPNQGGNADNNVFENGIDSVVKLTGLVDLSTSTIAADVLTIVAP